MPRPSVGSHGCLPPRETTPFATGPGRWNLLAEPRSFRTAPTRAILDALAAAYAESGQFPAAIKTAEAAADLAATGQTGMAAEIRQRLALYRKSQSFRE